MSLPTGLKPRSDAARAALLKAIYQAPLRVGVPDDDDGWVSAQLRIAGRVPVCTDSQKATIDAVLERLGLPASERGEVDASLGADLRLRARGEVRSQTLPAVEGPLVSLLVCTYNRRAFLPAAIASARAQAWPCEIVVVNDGSSDGTQEWLDAQTDLVVVHQENQGKPTALNAALKAASGAAVLVLDDDDLLLPGAIQVLARALFANPQLGMVFGDTLSFDGDSGKPRRWIAASRLPPSRAFEGTLAHVPGMPGACLIRRTTQDLAGAYPKSMVRGQDMDMYLRLAHEAPYASIPLATFLYRVHDGLRGSAAGQWKREEHASRFRSFVQPMFLQRLAEYPPQSMDMRHSWAMGMHQRGLLEEGRALVEGDLGPFSARQHWIRKQLGLESTAAAYETDLLVVHDGDEGALQATLERWAADTNLWIRLEAPADPLDEIRYYWEGQYTGTERVCRWIASSGALRVRLSSAPDWAPPDLPGPQWLPDTRASEALFVTALALGWPLPNRDRAFAPVPLSKLGEAVLSARQSLSRGAAADALGHLEPVLAGFPSWAAGWILAAEIFGVLGLSSEVAACTAQAQVG